MTSEVLLGLVDSKPVGSREGTPSKDTSVSPSSRVQAKGKPNGRLFPCLQEHLRRQPMLGGKSGTHLESLGVQLNPKFLGAKYCSAKQCKQYVQFCCKNGYYFFKNTKKIVKIASLILIRGHYLLNSFPGFPELWAALTGHISTSAAPTTR